LQQFLLFFCFSTRDLQVPRADLREILPHGRKHVQFTNAGPKIWGPAPSPPPKKWEEDEKHVKFGPISYPFPFEREYLRNGQRYPKPENYLTDSISSRVGQKKFGELWSTNHEVQLYPQNRLFRKTISRPIGGAAPRNFYTRHIMAKTC